MHGRPALVILIAVVLGGCGQALSSGGTTAPVASVAAGATASALPATSASLAPSPVSTGSVGAPPPRTILVDTDVAADDIVALAFLVRAPNIKLAGITVSGTGEAHCSAGASLVLEVLDRLDAPDVPVACGRETPLKGSHAFPDGWRQAVDAGSGLQLTKSDRGLDSRTAVQLTSDLADEIDGLVVVTLGPLTNLAEALQKHPALSDRLARVYIMGGALHVPGNLVGPGAPTGNHVAEWNVYIDPFAAQVVVDSGVEPSFVSLDGTSKVPVDAAFVARVRDEATAPAAQLLEALFDANPFMTGGDYYLWDPLAAEMAVGYTFGTFESVRVAVDQREGAQSGATGAVDGTPNAEYLSDADPTLAMATLFEVLNRP
jgi:inosine-uridine nucleoside N-ribohydrolase